MDNSEQTEPMWPQNEEDYAIYEAKLRARIAELDAAIQREPNNGNLYVERGKESFMLGEFLHDGNERDEGHKLMNQAMADYDHAIELEPTKVRYLFIRAYFYNVQYMWEQAIADYSRILELEPDNLKYRQTRAGWYEQRQKFEEAIADYTYLINLLNSKPDRWNITWSSQYQEDAQAEGKNGEIAAWMQGNLENLYRGRAKCYQAAEQYAEAIADYTCLTEHGIVEDPRYDSLYVPRAQCYTALKQYPEALADYDRAQQVNSWSGFDKERARIYKKMGDSGQAIAEYTASIDKLKESLAGWQGSGRQRSKEEILGSVPPPLREHIKNRPDIIARIQQETAPPLGFTTSMTSAIAQRQVESELAELYRSRASEYNKLERYEEVAADYTQAIQLMGHQDSVSDYINRGNAYRSLQRYEEAIADYNLVIERASNPAAEKKRQNDQYESQARSQIEMTKNAFKKLVEGNPNSESLMQQWEQRFANQIEEIHERFDKLPAPNMERTLEAAYGNRGLVYTLMGYVDEALADFHRVLALASDDPGTLFNIACMHGRKHEATEALSYLKRALLLNPELRENVKVVNDFGWLIEHDTQFANEFRRLVASE